MKKLLFAFSALASLTCALAQSLPEGTARVHYFRPDGNYEGWGLHAWEDADVTVSWDKPLQQTGKDAFGVYFDVKLKNDARKLGFIVHKGDDKDPGPDQFLDLTQSKEAWIVSGSSKVNVTLPDTGQPKVNPNARPAPAQPDNTLRIHYNRPDAVYEGWGLHLWEDAAVSVEWTKPFAQTGITDYGAFWDVPLKNDAAKVGFIVHKGDDKDPGPDMMWDKSLPRELWLVSGSSKLFTEKPDLSRQAVGDLSKQQAHWLTKDMIAIKAGSVKEGAKYLLNFDINAGLKLSADGVEGGRNIELDFVSRGLSEVLAQKFPHLREYAVLKIKERDLSKIPNILAGQVAVSVIGTDKKPIDATGVQTYGVLDDMYAYFGTLGATFDKSNINLKLWAPTAQSVKLFLYNNANDADPADQIEPSFNNGVWSTTIPSKWKNKFYLYQVSVFHPMTGKIETSLVTDPYSVALSLNSKKSWLMDLNDPATQPAGWAALKKPALDRPTDLSIYELHVRDFSAADATVPANTRGTYLAFTQQNSAGMKHLKSLAAAGLKAIHLLPTFDIATINENKPDWKTTPDLTVFGPADTRQQEEVSKIKEQDAFNWGYDPYHYMVPEGSYAVSPTNRTKEYRQMVMGLNQAGLRVIQDVVFNHTNAAGMAEKSVLDRIVPGYYHRLNLDGGVENSTCCANTATEHKMMEKLMLDSVVFWAKAYKVDGFRFDLMGHHMLQDMKNVRKALDALTLAKDGVDGKKIYVYGEGWDFGEVQGGKRGVNATQLNLYGTGIGSFNDRIRDALRGGSPFTDPREQGFATGLLTSFNGFGVTAGQQDRLKNLTDLLKVGISGNLRDFTFKNAAGETVKGSQVLYNGNSAAGYAANPDEDINYVSAHDNETLFDAIQWKAPANADLNTRVRMNNLSLSVIMLSQGIPFFHAGDDLLRSKSLDRDSYNSGDWFNRLDFSYQESGWGAGLPVAEKNQDKWDLMRPLLSNPALKPASNHILRARDHFQDLLRVRYSSDLFRLATAREVQSALSFLETPESVLAYTLTGKTSASNPYSKIVVVFNASPSMQSVQTGVSGLTLHPVLQKSTDSTLKLVQVSGTQVNVPAWTTAVLVK
ncbi:pullulanase-type alpha-1,6-glucosidase [Deinococcus cellulosilyticus]|uniref:pullulanase n=1 Tax=Deinococcus cellulosilyticus (strain DSM 18568 / NBRC 106333 / KACC 11606 / 5516J-15) TaxID=1223518 RepID=A0A511N3I1_DEIC1|nr:pullulanase-type alpha-1,6-glucosidase [Deinococcus cellulosilyticus]GEM47047.1 alpha-dextran endo-1,6-alpha-glucosidase [Deinococcus cellulosilyticus NBRC 106333 = KACC 11606]